MQLGISFVHHGLTASFQKKKRKNERNSECGAVKVDPIPCSRFKLKLAFESSRASHHMHRGEGQGDLAEERGVAKLKLKADAPPSFALASRGI